MPQILALSLFSFVLLILLWRLERKHKRLESFAIHQAARIERLETEVVRLQLDSEGNGGGLEGISSRDW